MRNFKAIKYMTIIILIVFKSINHVKRLEIILLDPICDNSQRYFSTFKPFQNIHSQVY